ncbi:hypothetical protein D3C86_2100390 [compost metagenome]
MVLGSMRQSVKMRTGAPSLAVRQHSESQSVAQASQERWSLLSPWKSGRWTLVPDWTYFLLGAAEREVSVWPPLE